jgi:hypothetical protein
VVKLPFWGGPAESSGGRAAADGDFRQSGAGTGRGCWAVADGFE